MRQLLFLFGLIFFSASSWAQDQSYVASSVHALLSYGTEIRSEKDIDGNYKNQNFKNYALGFGLEKFVFIFEKAHISETTGNDTLNLNRNLDDMLFWSHWRAIRWGFLAPYAGFGIGAYQESVETNLAGAPSKKDFTPYRFLSGVNLGLSLDVPVVWLSVEGRLLFGEELDQQPTLGALLRLGMWF